jgi:hypothetical protein
MEKALQVIVHRREPLMPKKYLLSVTISILTILLLPVSVLPISADYSAETNASTRYVAVTGDDTGSSCTDPSAPCRNIQYAINQSALSGDTIKVAAGTYTYSSTPTGCQALATRAVVCTNQKNLTILGGYTTANWSTAYPSVNLTIIDGASTYRGVWHFSYSSASYLLNMEGFTIRNGKTMEAPDAMGGGLLAQRTSLILRDMVFDNNQAIGANIGSSVGSKADGAAIRIQSEDSLGSTALLQRVVVKNSLSQGGAGANRGGIAFGAIYIYNVVATIEDSSIINNLAEAGDSGGNGTVNDMHADALGGGITVMNASLTLTRTSVTGNEIWGGDANASGIGGGAFGGGIFVEGVDIGDGHGLYLSTITMADCYVSDNLGTSGSAGTGGDTAGGGFNSVDSLVTIDRSQFVSNRILGGYGSSQSGPGSGGGLYIFAIHSGIPRATLRNVVIADNYANQGGGTTSPYRGGGGGLFVQGIGADITHATFARNRLGPVMTGGQALYVEKWPPYPADVKLNYSIISDHTEGGAIPYAIVVTNGNTLTFNQGLFTGNDNNIINEGTTNGLGSMTSASTAGYIYSPGNNYHLRADSPAKDPTSGGTLYDTDYEGQIRPYNTTSDFGADEYHHFSLFAGIGDSTLQVDWASEIAYLVGGLHHYKLTVTCEAGASDPDQVSCGGTINVGEVTHLALTGLTNGMSYYASVKAYDASDVMIATSNTADAIPTDVRYFLPLIIR